MIRKVFLSIMSIGLALVLSGCSVDPLTTLEIYLGLPEKGRENALAEVFPANDQVFRISAFLGQNYLFTDQDQVMGLIKTETNFYQYALGSYLAVHPDMTYQEFRNKVKGSEEISSAEFAYYGWFGSTWVESLKRDNQYLVERVELFKARLGLTDDEFADFFENMQGSVAIERYAEFIRNDDDFETFLTDDRYAENLLDDLREYYPVDDWDLIQLGPAFTGIMPGTGS